MLILWITIMYYDKLFLKLIILFVTRSFVATVKGN